MTDGTPLFPKAPPRDVSHAYFVDVWNPGFLFFGSDRVFFFFSGTKTHLETDEVKNVAIQFGRWNQRLFSYCNKKS